MTPKEFAEALVKADQLNVGSFNKGTLRCDISLSEACQRVNKEWAVILDAVLTHGYAEVWEWVEQQGVPIPGEDQAPTSA